MAGLAGARIWAICLVLFFLICYQVHGDSHLSAQTQQLGSLTFHCKDGWSIYQSDCYLFVNISLTWSSARDTCDRQGGVLFWFENELEYDYVKEYYSTSDRFWTGLKQEGGSAALWSHSEEAVDLRTISVWGNNEPGSHTSTTCAVADKQAGLGLKHCGQRLPFVCKYHACLEGSEPCATGGKCILESDKCDGRYDCEDHSDERDCTKNSCNRHLTAFDAGSYSFGDLTDGAHCTYIIEAAVGKRIKLSLRGTTVEEDIVFIEISTGSPDSAKAVPIASLTGAIQARDYFSNNNFMIVQIQAGDTSVAMTGIMFSWTVGFPELPEGVETVIADTTWRTLSSPSTQTPLVHLELSWIIEAPAGEVVSYYLETYDKSEGSSLEIQEGEMADDYTRSMDEDQATKHFYVSAASTLQVLWNSGNGMSSFSLRYRTGCSMEIDAKHGYIATPRFWDTGSYPVDLTCEWILNGGNGNTGLSVNFNTVDLDKDPRESPKSVDQIKYSIAQPDVFSFMESTGVVYSPIGYVKVQFISDPIINEGIGFEAEFSVDCGDLGVSQWTHKSSSTTMSGTTVGLSCVNGYRFDAEEYSTKPLVELHCNPGGVWSSEGNMDIRIPNCRLIQCGVPTEIHNGYIKNVTKTSYEGIAEYNCNDGFAKSHSDPVVCGLDGKWQNVPECRSSECLAIDIQNVLNGDYVVDAGNNITRPSVDFDTVVKFVCNPGYELKGTLYSHCRNQGWSDPKPECIVKYCPVPDIDNANLPASGSRYEYRQTITITCKSGYRINGGTAASETLTCGSDRTFSPAVQCLNIDECDTSPCDSTSTTCKDTDGSFSCDCLDGFERSSSSTSCADIQECSDGKKGGCSDICSELPGSYACSCPSGWTLFTQDGTSGFYIPPGETGNRYGDVYFYNHTCVRKSCQTPVSVAHGTVLTTKTSFHYEDSIELVCDDGYHITGSPQTTTRWTITCGDNGWDRSPTCSVRTCSVPTTPNQGSFDKTIVSFGMSIVLTCQWTAMVTKTRTAKCIYENGITRFGGDDITTCPEIDCGNPVLPAGGIIDGASPSSTKHLDHPNFKFGCASGFMLQGTSESGDTMVTCKENGRWSLSTLTCSGQRCNDPGTPAEARQVVENYEVGKTLHYECNRPGFEPDPKLNYTCEQIAGSARWSNNLANNLPQCKDVTKPEISNIQTSPVYRDYMKTFQLNVPTITDNFGLKHEVVNPDIQAGDIVTGPQIVTYTAEDYEGNTESATVEVRVIDRTLTPQLVCPDFQELLINSQTAESYYVSQLVSSTANLQFSPEFVTKSMSKIGTYDRIDVTATDQFGTKAYCSFLITYRAGKCFQELLHADAHANRICTSTSGDGLSCMSTCDSGYIYGDGQTVKTFTCSGSNVWNVVHPHAYCLPSWNPAYLFKAIVKHTYEFISGPCLSEFQSAISQRLSTFKSNMETTCPGMQWEIRGYSSELGRSSFDFKTEFSVELLSTTATDSEITSCLDKIKQNKDIFDLQNDALFCVNATRAEPIKVIKDIEILNPEFQCDTSGYIMITLSNGNKCVPCGPGREHQNDACVVCPSGEYQDSVEGSCRSCNQGETPNQEKTACVSTCPRGFTSANGLFPCTPCARNSFWSSSTACLPCAADRSTSGREGGESENACYASCPVGQYSLTGYTDEQCDLCPRNFYQPSMGQRTCLECPVGEITLSPGQTSQASCQPYSFTSGQSCNRAYCNDHGTCAFWAHRPVCSCDEGYQGDRCETSYHICDVNPCLNGAACVRGTNYLQYSCTCNEVLDRNFCFAEKFDRKEGGQGYFDSIENLTLEDCLDGCLQTDNCHSVTYKTGVPTFCLKYDQIFPLIDLVDKPEGTHYNRNCTGFSGQRCEQDNINDCETSQCSDSAMCMDKVGGYECLCPSAGNYQGQYCDVSPPCNNNPCQHGTCQNFGEVRYQCTCLPGYTGVNCETNINECNMNSGACLYGGSCQDGIDTYSCSCSGGFSGGNCENAPDYCSSKTCMGGNICHNSIDDRSGICFCELPYYNNTGSPNFDCVSTSARPCDFVSCVNGTCNSQARCDCEAGFTGSLCQHSIDDCTASPCVNGDCIDGHQTTSCSCWTGYTGPICDINVDDCAGQCTPNGNCVDEVDGFHCACNPGYTGDRCQTEIDECASHPCQHGGACQDLLADFNCSCTPGWVGKDCSSWVDNCQSINCQNNGQCYSLVSSAFCRCGGGTLGEFCEDRRSVCETLGHVNVCINGGVCENDGGSAICSCPAVFGNQSLERCFDTVYMDREGGNGDEITHFTDISVEACKTHCLNNPDCRSVSYFYNTAEQAFFCKLYNRRKEESDLIVISGGQHFDKDCPTDYVGPACDLIRDWCSENPCANNGQCITESPGGYRCQCQQGYSGPTCKTVANPCSSAGCPSDAMCRSSLTEFYCQCSEGREILAGKCRDLASVTDHVILLNNPSRESASTEGIPTLKTPFRLTGNQFSVMFRVRIHARPAAEPYNVLRLRGSEQLFPLQDQNAILVMQITNRAVTLTYNTQTIFVQFGTSLNSTGGWHHIGISLDSNGELSCTIDAVEIQNKPRLSGTFNVDLNAQILLGAVGMVAEFKDVTVWQMALSNSDFSQAMADEAFRPTGTLLQGWWNYKLTRVCKFMTQALSDNLYREDKSVPQITCDTSLYEKTSSVRYLTRGSLTHLMNRMETMSLSHPFKHSIPEVVMWGYYSCVVIVEGSNNRYADCRFPVYIKYNDQCPAPIHSSDVTVIPCDNNQGICGLSCINNNKKVCAATPRYQACGVLGVYDWTMPYAKHVLPSCTADEPPKYVVKASFHYNLVIECSSMTPRFDEVRSKIKEIFLSLRQSWRDICVGQDCSNLAISKISCNSDAARRLDIEFSLSFDRDLLEAQVQTNLGSSRSDGELKLVDALKSIILIERKIDLSWFATASLVPSSVMVTMKMACANQGRALIGGRCVPCCKGLYYSSNSETCEFCDLGSFSAGEGMTSCTSCGSAYSTIHIGSTDRSQCVDNCSVGHFYNETSSSCEACQRNSYQDQTGQSFCKDCVLGFKTETVMSTQESDCKEGCPAGYYRNQAGSCVQCARGFWRDLIKDDCQRCKSGYTTLPHEIGTSEEKCEMKNCSVGTSWDIDNQSCESCAVGTYQDEPLMLDCKSCDANFTTALPGADNEEDCITECPGGQEYNITSDICVYCTAGTYKPATEEYKFKSCEECPQGFITDGVGKTMIGECNIRNCPPGSFDNGNNCQLCEMGFYQEKWTQKNCTACGLDLHTVGKGADSFQDCQIWCAIGRGYSNNTCVDCPSGYFKATAGNTHCQICPLGKTSVQPGQAACDILHCEKGKTEVNGACVECEVGYFKNDSGNNACTKCPGKTTTAGKGTVLQADCNIVVCDPGQYRPPHQTTECTDCSYNYYQHEPGQTACIYCGADKVTMEEGSTSSDACVDECQAGEQYNSVNKSCDECIRGYYKGSKGNFEMCEECPVGYTTVGKGATAAADCTETACPAGSYVKIVNATVSCLLCPIGYFQPEKTQMECLSCDPGYITLKEGSISSRQCVVDCQPGHGLIYGPEIKCLMCEIGQYNNKTGLNTHVCKYCPGGYTTITVGKTSCDIEDLGQPATEEMVKIIVRVLYECETDCSDTSLAVIRTAIETNVRSNVLKRKNTFIRLCGQDGTSCDRISVKLLSCGNRKKRAVTHTVEAEITLPNVTKTVDDTRNDEILNTANLVAGLFEVNPVEFTPQPGVVVFTSLAAVPTVIRICNPGYVLDSYQECVACAAGQYWLNTNTSCVSCPIDHYQDQEAQVECKICPDNSFSDTIGATSADTCKSFCGMNPDHCNERGDCEETDRRTATCQCWENYSGDRCETKTTPTSSTTAIIIGSIAGGLGLLIIVLIVIAVFKCMQGSTEHVPESDVPPEMMPVPKGTHYYRQISSELVPWSGEWSDYGHHNPQILQQQDDIFVWKPTD